MVHSVVLLFLFNLPSVKFSTIQSIKSDTICAYQQPQVYFTNMEFNLYHNTSSKMVHSAPFYSSAAKRRQYAQQNSIFFKVTRQWHNIYILN